MFIVSIILISLGCIVAILLILALFLKKDYALERSISVNRTKPDTFHFISSLKNQDSFSKWANIDPNMKKEYVGEDRTIGFTSKWESPHKQVGQGEQEIKALKNGEFMETEIRFLKPFRAVAKGGFQVDQLTENESKVTWSMSSRMPYPFNLFLLLMDMEKTLGKDFDEGLNNMKRIIESE